MAHLLIIEDEPSLRDIYRRLMEGEGYTVTVSDRLKPGTALIEQHAFDLIMSDVRLPDGKAIEEFGKWLKINPNLPIILLTAYGNVPDCAYAIKHGAYDYLVKGDDDNRIIPTISAALRQYQHHKAQPMQVETTSLSLDNIAQQCPDLANLINQLQKVALTSLPVLILGESGVGKEWIAKAIHQSSGLRGEFVAVNCAALPSDLLESELFGHVKGAFTGAIADKTGLVETAQQGTLFLDEIGELPLDLQAKILRLLEGGTYYKVGDPKVRKAGFRLLTATNVDIRNGIAERLFREDLYYRINDFELVIPPLRDRKQDLLALIQFYAGHVEIEPEALQLLTDYNWPGNIRQLRKVLTRATLLCTGNRITVADLPAELHIKYAHDEWLLEKIEFNHIRKALVKTEGNRQAAADLLGIGIATLYRKIKE